MFIPTRYNLRYLVDALWLGLRGASFIISNKLRTGYMILYIKTSTSIHVNVAGHILHGERLKHLTLQISLGNFRTQNS